MTANGTNIKVLRKAIDYLLAEGKGELALEVELALRDVENKTRQIEELRLKLESASNDYWSKG